MKRHESLIPLSHVHHKGLVVAQGLILGRSKAPRSTWPSDRGQQVDRVITFFETDLSKHFEAEEMHLFPVVRARLREGATLVDQLIEDHNEMRARVRGLVQDPATGLVDRLRSFGELLKAHIRKEEKVLFERMQQEMNPAELKAIGAGLRYSDRPDGIGSACRS